ncbi:hypothetical protein PRNP1_004236 [Phytophthora ramorum]
MYKTASVSLHCILWNLSWGRSLRATSSRWRTASRPFTSDSFSSAIRKHPMKPNAYLTPLLSTHGWKSNMTHEPWMDVWKPLNMTDPWPVQKLELVDDVSDSVAELLDVVDDAVVVPLALAEEKSATKLCAAGLSVVMLVASEHVAPVQMTWSTK